LGFLGVLGVLAVHSASAQEDVFHTREVPYVATPQVTVDEMLRLASVGPQDFVLDLGSGDGRIVVTAAKKFGARGLGVDLDWRLVQQGEENARRVSTSTAG
jgi:cyclopropane fatty-acyl-phospholipid synthase-like methyltransferase